MGEEIANIREIIRMITAEDGAQQARVNLELRVDEDRDGTALAVATVFAEPGRLNVRMGAAVVLLSLIERYWPNGFIPETQVGIYSVATDMLRNGNYVIRGMARELRLKTGVMVNGVESDEGSDNDEN